MRRPPSLKRLSRALLCTIALVMSFCWMYIQISSSGKMVLSGSFWVRRSNSVRRISLRSSRFSKSM